VNIWREIQNANAGFVTEDSEMGIKAMLTKWIYLSKDEKSKMTENAKKLFINNFLADEAAKKLKALLFENVN